MVLSAADQLDRVVAALVESGGILGPDSVIDEAGDSDSDLSAQLQLVLSYASGHRLHVRMIVDVRYGYPHWELYSFHFQDGVRTTVFRYDNWPNHREVETFPHHKHVGPAEEVLPHAQPSLAAIVREILGHVGS